MSKVAYRIYPSLLNKFQDLLDYEIVAEEFWNIDDEGEYKRTPDEIHADLEQELLDAVNRMPHEPSEAADKGTCFNEVIDCILMGVKSTRDDVKVCKSEDGLSLVAEMDGFRFFFDKDFCREVASRFDKGYTICQKDCRCVLPTAYGDVELYGYADYVGMGEVVDLKTTSRYDLGKYSRNWQKVLYPYALVESGECKDISMFTFLVALLTKPSSRNPVIRGTLYTEDYNYDHVKAGESLTAMCERFIEWLEVNRERITDAKVFGGEN